MIVKTLMLQKKIGHFISGDIEKPGKIRQMFFFQESIASGQIIATSDDLTPNGGLVREIPLFQGNLGW